MHNAIAHSLIALALLFPGFVLADSPEDLAKQFVTLMRYSDQHREYQGQCLAAAKTVPPESLARQNPDRFYGIRPGTKLWSEVVKAYELYYRQACERPTQTEFLDAMAAAYAREMSQSELRQAINFYSTPTGKRLISAHKAAVQEVYRKAARANSQQIPIADRNFDRRLLELSKKGAER